MLTLARQCRSSPSRWRYSCGATRTVTIRSPASRAADARFAQAAEPELHAVRDALRAPSR